MRDIAIVGASLAGTSAAAALRDAGFDGTIRLIDAASELPSDRPPLSKQVLAGTMTAEAAAQPIASRLDELEVDLVLSTTAEALDAETLTIRLGDGSELSADGIVLATGATPRRLDTRLDGVHALRTMEDCLALKADLDAGPTRVLVVGAGFIGAEVAATCRGLGLDVTMVEALPWPLQRVLPGEIGGFVADLHASEGVDVRLGVGVAHVEGGDRVERVVLSDGSAVDADVVVAGIGVVPSIDWLRSSSLALGNGVRCDETCMAAPGIVAAGDLCEWRNPLYDEAMRVEQWENAIEQGTHAGRRLLEADGAATPFASVPWFWSDQYDRKIQLAGRVRPDDQVEIVEGSIEERRFVALFRRGDRCVAALGVNRPRHVVQLRMAMGRPLPWGEAVERFR
jgi:3-phenylpropionate/trans-cinnamate dioxygenase ferredoxin reductase subunit